MMQKLRIGLLFGGPSCEHEVSVISARSVAQAIDLEKYQLQPIGVDKQGHWLIAEDLEALIEDDAVRPIDAYDSHEVILQPHFNGNLWSLKTQATEPVDVIFPLIHGSYGEDGVLQGLLDLANIPYVGCGVAASAIAIDKSLTKIALDHVKIKQAPYVTISSNDWQTKPQWILDHIAQNLSLPLFIKPCKTGSSVGITKVKQNDELVEAINYALKFDHKLLVEQSQENVLEVECAVLGNTDAKASTVGEIVPGAEFYDYATKYLDDKTSYHVPARLPENVIQAIQSTSIQAFNAIGARGMARIDFFVDKENHDIILNEINTIPGFTPISMYPKLWAKSGVPYSELISQLIALAEENHNRQQNLTLSYHS